MRRFGIAHDPFAARTSPGCECRFAQPYLFRPIPRETRETRENPEGIWLADTAGEFTIR